MECNPKKEVRSITVEIFLDPPDDTIAKFIDHMEESYGLNVKVVDEPEAGKMPPSLKADLWVTLTGTIESLEKWFVEWFTNTDSLSVSLKLWEVDRFEDLLDDKEG